MGEGDNQILIKNPSLKKMGGGGGGEGGEPGLSELSQIIFWGGRWGKFKSEKRKRKANFFPFGRGGVGGNILKTVK